jgi:hypothetical protein
MLAHPVRTFLREREPLLPHKRLIEIFGHTFAQKIEGIRPEQALEVVATTTWAKGLAQGVCGPGYAGFTPGTPEYDSCVYNVSHKVAAGTLGMSWTPPPMPAPLPTRRPRRA